MIHSFRIENDVLEMDIYEISKYPLLLSIYNRDITTTKEIARKELMYIHFMADKNGYCTKSGLTAAASHAYSRDNAGLGKTFKADKLITSAIEFVKDNLQITVVEDLINTTVKSLNLTGRVVNHIATTMEDIIDDKSFNIEDLIKVESNLKALIKIATNIPQRIKDLNDLMNTWRKQDTGVDTLRGGNDYAPSYDGDGEGVITNSSALHIED